MLKLTFLQSTSTFAIALIVFSLIIIFYLIGYYSRQIAIKKNPNSSRELGSIAGTTLGLLGLLLAFTFSMSSSRYDKRREIIVEEANNIGTAVLRADLYPDSTRQLLRKNFKEYVNARLDLYNAGMNVELAILRYKKADSLGSVLWNITTNDAKINNNILRTAQMIPALNAMIDITTTRSAASLATVPDSIMYFLFILCFSSAFLLGYDNTNKVDWIIVTGFSLMLSLTIFNIIDLDRPRSGIIKMDQANEKIVLLKNMFD